MNDNKSLNIYYQENKKQYRRRTLFYKVMSILILLIYIYLLIYLYLKQLPIFSPETSIDRRIGILILFILIGLTGIVLFIFAFSKRKYILRDDVLYPPKVPIKYLIKKQNYHIKYNSIEWFEVQTSPSGDIEAVLIKHPDFFIIDIHIPLFPIEAVRATINQLRRKVGEKEKKLGFG
jgi:hypothetical protein